MAPVARVQRCVMCGLPQPAMAVACKPCGWRIDDPRTRSVLELHERKGHKLLLGGLAIAHSAVWLATTLSVPFVWVTTLMIGTFLLLEGSQRVKDARAGLRRLELPATRLLKG